MFLVISCQNNISGNVVKEVQEQNIANEDNAEAKDAQIIIMESDEGYKLEGSLTW
tara:strand:- start:752 stop:916 length:165 start_codon:yes stop_codon:yes gene_type:complete